MSWDEVADKDGNIDITANFDNGKMTMIIEDDGPGISDEQKMSLFKPFYTTKVSGTGLGLATAYKAAVDHGGELKVESKTGGPTKFIVSLPLSR